MEQTPHTFADFELFLDIDSLSMCILLRRFNNVSTWKPWNSSKVPWYATLLVHLATYLLSGLPANHLLWKGPLWGSLSHTHLALLPLVKRQVFCVRDQLKRTSELFGNICEHQKHCLQIFCDLCCWKDSIQMDHVNSLYNLFTISNCPAASS